MKRRVVAAISSLLCATATAQAQGIIISPLGATPTTLGAPQNFTGHVAVDFKAAGNSGRQGSVGQVDFAPGARTAWHTHPAGQLLIVTEGKGWVQEEGRPMQEIKAGDVVWIEANIKHWHGAAEKTRMSHLAVAYVRDGKSADFKEPVSDDQYLGR
jgi:quercetin dioxygenase-like cupin family protein